MTAGFTQRRTEQYVVQVNPVNRLAHSCQACANTDIEQAETGSKLRCEFETRLSLKSRPWNLIKPGRAAGPSYRPVNTAEPGAGFTVGAPCVGSLDEATGAAQMPTGRLCKVLRSEERKRKM